MKGRNPTADEKRHMAKVAALGCIVCWNENGVNTPAAIHHIDGKTKKGSHFKVLPLCFEHHQGGCGEGRFISRHPWKKRFEKAYGTEQELLEQVNRLVE
jgi:hypothetical protein